MITICKECGGSIQICEECQKPFSSDHKRRRRYCSRVCSGLRLSKDMLSGNTRVGSGRPRSHGMTGTVEYTAFKMARRRCQDTNTRGYKNYGGRGIRFLFSSFEQWFAELGLRPTPMHSINRINNDGHYEPGNVEWATRSKQNENRRSQQRPP